MPRVVAIFLRRDFIARLLGNIEQQIHALKQHINLFPSQLNLFLLRGHEAIFQRVGHAHRRLLMHNARRALQGMRGPHERFQLLGRSRIAFEFKQAGRDGRRLVLGLHAEQVRERKQAGVSWLVWFHVRLRFRVANTNSASRHPTIWSCQASKPKVKLALALATVAGAGFNSSA